MIAFRHILFFLAFYVLCNASSPPAHAEAMDFKKLSAYSNEQLLNTIKIYKCSEAELNMLLPELHRRFPDFSRRLKAVALMYTGAPYVNNPLTDEGVNFFPYDKTDCTMFVLYAAAFANSRSFTEAIEHMRQLHYRQGTVGFKSRYHFTEDRITDPENKYFSAITEQYIKKTWDLKQVSLVLNRKKDGTCLFGDRLDGWSKKVTLSYIPRDRVIPGMLKPLPASIGIAFVKKSNWEKGIIVGHEGLLIDGDLYHASPGKGVRVIKNFLANEFHKTRWEGIILFSMNDMNIR